MKKNVTLKDIAERIGVSAVTVSKALTNKEGVSDDVRKKIKETADDMGYKYGNTLAAGGQSGIVGVIGSSRFMNEVKDTFYLKMYRYLVQVLLRFSYYSILEIVSPESENEQVLPNLLEDKKVDGLIVLGQFRTEYISMLMENCSNMVLLDFYDENCNADAIISDSVYGSYRATNYLIKNGHKKIAFLGSRFSTHSIMDRYIGYYKALLEAGLELRDEWVIEDRAKETGEYIPFEFPAKENMPTAFVCSCDQVCYLLIESLEKMGYRVPEDISVVGYDNFTYAGIPALKLTTVEVDMEAMTEQAADLIIKKIKGEKHFCGMRIVESKLIIRESVKNLN